VFALLVLACINGAFAQAPAKFVTWDVVALDAHGEPVLDLQPSQIRLTDNKQPESVVYWRSDRRHPDAPPATVVVIDISYAPVKSVAWNEAIRTMSQFESSTYLYFYVKTARNFLLPIHELPAQDADTLPVNSPWMEKNIAPLEATLRFEPSQETNAMTSFTMYMDLAARLAAFPGRKSLVCIGCLLAKAEDWKPFTTSTGAQVGRAVGLRQVTEAFHEANVAVYPISGAALSGRIGPGNFGGLGFPPGSLNDTCDARGAIADVTGGRCYAAGEVGMALRQAIRDNGSSYRLAYLPLKKNWDGKPHKLAISSIRAGVHLLTPRWYIADNLDDIARERGPSIPDIAITSPLDQSGITVVVSASPQTQGSIPLNIHVFAEDLLLVPRDGRYSGSLALQVICYTPDQRRQACTEPAAVKLDLSEQQYQAALRDGLRFPANVPIDAAPSRLRVIVHDMNSGATGSATIQLSEDR
jgi:VWFA-related protein